jgi:asparagine synthase (glutamine-hydrolysing)
VAAIMESLVHCADLGLGLARLDRQAARHGAEERHPFVDVRVVELMLSLPCEERSDRGINKAILRRAMADTLPPLVRDRRDSANFNSYLQAAFLGPYRAEILSLFDKSRVEEMGLVDGPALRRALSSDMAGPAFRVANLVGLELWLRCGQQ